MKKDDALFKVRRAIRVDTSHRRQSPPQTPFEGRVDTADWTLVTGWARCPVEPQRIVTVDVFVDGILVFSVLADQYRPDLVAAGMPHGRHGFAMCIPRLLCVAPVVQLSVRDRATGADLMGSPVTLTKEEAGLDTAGKAFLTCRIEALDKHASLGSLDAHATFLRQLFDVVMSARAKAVALREGEMAHWSQIFAASPGGSLIARLVDVGAISMAMA